MYSQHDEEQYIGEALRGIPIGSFLEVGSYDGHTFSNSLALIEKGWSGVMVEPSPLPFHALIAMHGANPNLKLVNCLVGAEHRGLKPVWFSDDSLSTTEQANHEVWGKIAAYKPLTYTSQVTILEILAYFAFHPHFVSIDTEGTSGALFRNYPFDISQPKCFCVEYDGDLSILDFAAQHGYRMTYKTGENFVLVRD